MPTDTPDKEGLLELFYIVMSKRGYEKNLHKGSEPLPTFQQIVRIIKDLPEEQKRYALDVAFCGVRFVGGVAPIVVLVACFNDDKYKGTQFQDNHGVSRMYRYTQLIVRDGGDLAKAMWVQTRLFNEKLPMQFRRCMKKWIETSTEQELCSGLKSNNDVSVADCIKLLHPNPRASKRIGISMYGNIISGVVTGMRQEPMNSITRKNMGYNTTVNFPSTVQGLMELIDMSV